jgi:hypothetical protein
VLFREYADGDLAQSRLQDSQAVKHIRGNFYARGDGTCCYYFGQVHTILKSINVSSVAMRVTEELMPAIHQSLLGLVVVFDRLMPWAHSLNMVLAVATAAKHCHSKRLLQQQCRSRTRCMLAAVV